MTTENFYFYLQNRLIQTSQTGGQQYSDTSPISIPWTVANTLSHCYMELITNVKSFTVQAPDLATAFFLLVIFVRKKNIFYSFFYNAEQYFTTFITVQKRYKRVC